MGIRIILRNRVYLALALIYAISVVALCFRAPVVQQPVQLRSDEVEEQPASAIPGAIDLSAGIVPDQHQPMIKRATLWALGGGFFLNAPLFAVEQAELLGLVLLVALVYRFRSRFMICGAAIATFVGSRRRGTCVWLGFAVLLLLAVLPPWVQIRTYGGRFPTQRVKLWHAPIFRAPVDATRWESSDVDYNRMLMEVALGECFVLALYLTWARTKPVNDPKK